MKIKKAFEVTVGIKDTIDFCARKKDNVLRQLVNTYEGVCYMGCYISEILSVDAVSCCEIVLDTLDMEGRIHVQFTAYVIVYGTWDIVVGVRVVGKSQFLIGDFPGSADDAPMTVTLLNTDQAETVATDQTIAVRIHTVDYPPFQQRVMCVGMILTCDKKSPVYHTAGKLSPRDVADWVATVEAELRLRAEIYGDAEAFKRLMFFENILVVGDSKRTETIETGDVGTKGETPSPAWRGPKPPAGVSTPQSSIVNMLNLARKGGDVSGTWTRPVNVPRSSPIAVHEKKTADIALIPPALLFAELLKNMYTFLKATRELTSVFNEGMMIAHENVWASIQHAKKK